MKKKYIAVLLAGALVLSSLTVANAQETEKTGDMRQETLTDSEAEEQAGNEAVASAASDAANQPAVRMEDVTQVPAADGQTEDEGPQTADGGTQTADGDVHAAEQSAVTEESGMVEMTEEGNQDAAVQAEAGDDTADASEDRVYIPDETLQLILINNAYPEVSVDEDGYADREDLEGLTSLSVYSADYDKPLVDLTGLEAAVNLDWLTLEECGITSEFMEKNSDVLAALPELRTLYLSMNEITDLSFLKELPQVRTFDLSGNQITDFTAAFEICEADPEISISYYDNPTEGVEQIFEKCFFDVPDLLTGQSVNIYPYSTVFSGGMPEHFSDNANLTYTVADPDILGYTADIGEYNASHTITALSAGTTTVTAHYGSKELTFQVTVQDVMPAVDDADRLSPDQLAQGMSARSILTNGQIWNWDSADTPQKVSDGKNVKSYVAYWVYRDNDPEKTGRIFTEEYFGLDDAGTLWNWKKLYSIDEEYMETEIAENVRSMVHYEGRAGLYITESDECYMAYVDGTELITQFVCENAEYVTENGYVGLKDGTGLIISLDDDNRVLTEPVEFQPVDVGYYSEYNPGLGYSEGSE